MARTLTLTLLAVALLGDAAAGQVVRSRSAAYLYSSNVDDARALWVNPAGLAVVQEASVMAEFAVDVPDTGSARLGQWSVAFNSRGFSAGFQQDRLLDGTTAQTVRLGIGLGFHRGSLGGSFNFYTGVVDDRGGDIGLTYVLIRSVRAGFVVKNIGRPTLVDSVAPITGVLGLSWLAVPAHLEISAEAHFREDLANVTQRSSFRAGLQLSTGGKLPFGAIAAFDLGSNGKVDAWSVGISVGGKDRGVLLGTAVPRRFERFSLTGVASRRAPTQRP